MNHTERYLKAATRGLWGAKKRELCAELEGHINERIQEFRLGGLSAEEAERQTLRELGTPRRVSGGMLGVYTVPAVGKAGAVSFLLAAALMTVVPQGLAQVQGIYSSSDNGPSSYLDFEQLKTEIEKAGGRISGQGDATIIDLKDAPQPPQPLSFYGFQRPTLVKDGKTYIQADALFYSLRNSGFRVSLSGWENPVLMAGSWSVRVETKDWQVINSFYAPTVQDFNSDLWSKLQIPFNLIEPESLNPTISFRGKFQKDKVYAIIIPKLVYWTGTTSDGKPMSGNLNLITSASQAQAASVQFHVPNEFKDFKLYSNINEFKAALEPYRKESIAPVRQWDAAHPAPVLVLELSGHFGPDAYKVVPPSSIQQP